MHHFWAVLKVVSAVYFQPNRAKQNKNKKLVYTNLKTSEIKYFYSLNVDMPSRWSILTS